MVAIPHNGTCQKDLVHSVNTLCSVQSEDSLFTGSDNAFLSVTDLPATCQFTSVHSVNTSHSVQASNDLVPMSVNAPLSIDKLPAQCQLSTIHSPGFTLSSPRSVRQELVPPSRVTPIDARKLQRELCLHPNQALVDYVISGLSFGFRLGFNPESVSLKSASQNMPTAFLQPSVIDQYLLTELEKGRVAGPFSISPLANLHISHFGIIPKKYQPGKWRLILDLSSPQGHSVNDGIPKDPFSVQYMKVDNIIDGIMTHGQGTLLAKFDVESAYRIIPVHSRDRYLLGMKWRGEYFIDLALPFGLRSAPFIFSSFADLLEWILKHNYEAQFLLHYLDDFHTLGPPDSPVCQQKPGYLCSSVFRLGYSPPPR